MSAYIVLLISLYRVFAVLFWSASAKLLKNRITTLLCGGCLSILTICVLSLPGMPFSSQMYSDETGICLIIIPHSLIGSWDLFQQFNAISMLLVNFTISLFYGTIVISYVKSAQKSGRKDFKYRILFSTAFIVITHIISSLSLFLPTFLKMMGITGSNIRIWLLLILMQFGPTVDYFIYTSAYAHR